MSESIHQLHILLFERNNERAFSIGSMLNSLESSSFSLDVAIEFDETNNTFYKNFDCLLIGPGFSGDYETFASFWKLSIPFFVLSEQYNESIADAAARQAASGYFALSELTPPQLCRSIAFAIKKSKAASSQRLLGVGERAIFDAVPDGFLFVKPDGTINDLNDTAAGLVGLEERDSLLGSNCLDFVHEADRNEMSRRLRIVCSKRFKGLLPRAEFRILRKDGSQFFAESTANPIIRPDGRATDVLLTIREITDQKNIRESLIKAKEQAEHASQLKSFFLANMSHEIRTPLNGILGFTDLLFEEAERMRNKTMTQFLNRIQKSSERLLRTLTEIIDISRIEADKVELNIEPSFIGDIIEKVIEQKINLAEEKGLAIEPKIEDIYAAQIDKEKLTQIADNIIDNAIKYTDAGTIRIETGISDDGLSVFLKVIDSGIGIGDKYMARIFEPFSQEYSGYARAYEGNGLGLSITKRLVDLMKGSISLKSKKGAGTIVTVSFPAVRDCSRPKRTFSVAGRSLNNALTGADAGERPHILIVDSDPDNRDFLEIALINMVTVNTAANAQEAMLITEQFYRRGRIFDLMIFSEKIGEELSGAELLEQFKEKWAEYIQIPVIAQIDFQSGVEKEKFYENGFSNFIVKPASRDRLFTILEEEMQKVH